MTPKLRIICVLIAGVLPCLTATEAILAETGQIKMRARENFELISVEIEGRQSKYKGFSHTLNLWYEIPAKWALGLAFGPFVVGYTKTNDAISDDVIGENIKLFNTGIEYKHWHDTGIFVRLGTYRQAFNGNTTDGKDFGYANLIGLGYEYSFDGWAIALEADYRRSFLVHKKWPLESQLVAIGVHFYEML